MNALKNIETIEKMIKEAGFANVPPFYDVLKLLSEVKDEILQTERDPDAGKPEDSVSGHRDDGAGSQYKLPFSYWFENK